MLNLRQTLERLSRNKRKWEALLKPALRGPRTESLPKRLKAVEGFGSNPGDLRMFAYSPPQYASYRALVVVLHGCTQTAEGYDHGAGWSTLAERYGFALLVPEQQAANNPKGCFNWFLPSDTSRDRGEALSIRQMIEKMVIQQNIDRRRIFVTGLSAGGAMTSAMLACYPDVFAGGAIIAGLPYGAARNVQQAFESMFQCPPRSAREWGDLVRAASSHRGPWPRVSVWHGTSDKTVIPSNAQEILKQWTDVHGLPIVPTMQAKVDGYPRQVWRSGAGEEMIESFALDIGHGTPLATGYGDEQCGAAGAFLLDVGISSSYHIAKFFGLTNERVSLASSILNTAGSKAFHAPERNEILSLPQSPQSNPSQGDAEEQIALEGEILNHESGLESKFSHRSRAPIDVNAIITRALTAAGLMKP